jgi:hypothetical protein
MLKTVIAALALSAGAVMVSTAAPAFASTGARTLTIGPQITVTVTCPVGEHAVDHNGQLSCVSDETYRAAEEKHQHQEHKARHHAKAKPAAKPTAKDSNPPVALPPWQQWPLQHQFGWGPDGQPWHDGYGFAHHWQSWL